MSRLMLFLTDDTPFRDSGCTNGGLSGRYSASSFRIEAVPRLVHLRLLTTVIV